MKRFLWFNKMKEIFKDIISSIQSQRKLGSSKDDEFWNEWWIALDEEDSDNNWKTDE